jgi:rubrerythrin
MGDAGNILPQAEIDALFKQATGRNLSTPPEVEAAKLVALKEEKPAPEVIPVKEPEKVQQAPAPQVSAPSSASQPDNETLNKVLNKLMDTMETLTKRIEVIETNIEKISNDKSDTSDYSDTIRQLSNKVQNDSTIIKNINNQMTSLKKKLKGTPGFNARDQFTCTKCGSHGYLAVPMKCSSCGTEGWWGWYPEK